MTPAEVWDLTATMVRYVGFVATVLLGLSLLGQV